jgi:hypothetical protein
MIPVAFFGSLSMMQRVDDAREQIHLAESQLDQALGEDEEIYAYGDVLSTQEAIAETAHRRAKLVWLERFSPLHRLGLASGEDVE